MPDELECRQTREEGNDIRQKTKEDLEESATGITEEEIYDCFATYQGFFVPITWNKSMRDIFCSSVQILEDNIHHYCARK